MTAAMTMIPLLLGGAPTDAELLESAPERIRRHRMTDLTVTVLDAAGQPAAGAEVRVEQQRHAFLFGCNIFRWGQLPPELEGPYRDRFTAVFNYATLPFYWAGYERQPGTTQQTRLRDLAGWCREQRITPKGHPLVWNHPAGAPGWLTDDLTEVRRLSDARITEIITGFRGLIDIWDVVNEPTDPWRFDNPLTEVIRGAGVLPFLKDCYRLAREAGPEATLILNDYRLDAEFGAIAAAMLEDERRYDVLGLQTHMHGGATPPSRLWRVCERFAELGVPLHFTETTIVSGPRDGERWETTPEGEATQAAEVERFYTLLFSHPAVEAITWWDFSDNGAWQNAPAGFLRRDMTPKPAYDVLRRLIRETWWTTETVRADERGRAVLRVFRGTHRVTCGAAATDTEVGAEAAAITLRRP